MKLNTIYPGDCLDVMPTLPAHSVDMVLCDLPYGKGTTDCHWDIRLDLGMLWKAWGRLLTERGAVVLTATQPFTSALVMSNERQYKHHWVWVKNRGTGFQAARYRPMMATEDIVVFSKRLDYHPQMTPLDKPYTRSTWVLKAKTVRELKSFTTNMGPRPIYSAKHPVNTLYFNRVEKQLVPTQKPVELFAYLIRTYTHPGAVVLDNCIGSGTTAIAALETGRRYVGIEKDFDHYKICLRRIRDYHMSKLWLRTRKL